MTTPEAQIHALPTATPDFAAQAREQADEYDSLFANTDLELNDGTTLSVPPHPDFGMLDDDAMDAYTELLYVRDTEYEREPDIYYPEQRLKNPDGTESGVVLPADTKRGDLKSPYRTKDAEGNSTLVKPAWTTQLVMAALGEPNYRRLREGGKSSADVWRIWGRQGVEAQARETFRSQVNASPVALAPVPKTDS